METNSEHDRPLLRKAVLFDLDGVIASTEIQKSGTHIETVLKLKGIPSQRLTELYVDVIGLPYEETRDRFLECGQIAATPEIMKLYRSIYSSVYRGKVEAVNLAPGAKQLLQLLTGRRYRIGLVSSAHAEEVTSILRRHRIETFFRVIVNADSVESHKPSPEPYLKALRLLGLEQTPNLAVAFEDTWAGITSARAAQLRVFAVRHRLNYKQNLTEADQVFDSLVDNRILPTIEEYLGRG
jgi:HAD superfamily hydrolase (TIGR01509 family)